MKRILSFVLVLALLAGVLPAASLAEEFMYAPVDVLLKKQNADLEAEYREWAASVLCMYYNDYCCYNMDSVEKYNADLPNHKDRNNAMNLLQEKLLFYPDGIDFSGINRQYYMVGEFKEYFDYILETDYSTHLSDKEANDPDKKNEADEQKKLTYMDIIAETLVETAENSPGTFEKLDVSNAKGYYEYNAQSGTIVYKEDGVMSKISEQNKLEITNLLVSFAVDTVNLIVDTALRYTGANEIGAAKLAQVIADSVLSMAKDWTAAVTQNEIAKLEYAITQCIQAEIANNLLLANDRLIKYLELVYSGEISLGTDVRFQDNAIFLEAVKEVLSIAKQLRSDSLKATKEEALQMVSEVFKDSSVIDKIKTDTELTHQIILIACSEIVNLVVDEGSKYKGKKAAQEPSKENIIYDCMLLSFGTLIGEMLKNAVESYKGNMERAMDVFLKKTFSEEFFEKWMSRTLSSLAEYGIKATDNFKIDFFPAQLKSMKAFSDAAYKMIEDEEWTDLFALIQDLLTIEEFGLEKVASNITDKDGKLKEFGKKTAGKLLDFLQEADLSKMLAVSESLANLLYSTNNENTGEDQDSFRSYQIYSVYQQSYKLKNDIRNGITDLFRSISSKPWSSRNKSDWINAVMEDSIDLNETQALISAIQIQLQMDIVGQGELINILMKGESGNWFTHSKFYKKLQAAMETSEAWSSHISLSLADATIKDMKHYSNSVLHGYKDKYDILFS